MKKKRSAKKVGKQWFFIVLALIVALTSVAFLGVKTYYGDKEIVYFKSAGDIRWGIDIQGGVEAVFSPETDEEVTEQQLNAAKETINNRLINLGVTDYETSIDTRNDQIIVRFPWQSNEEDFDAAAAINELGETAVLTFCTGSTYNEDNIVLVGSEDVKEATAAVKDGSPYVQLRLTSSGRSKFATATRNNIGKTIAICMDGEVISAPTVNETIDNGLASISGQNLTYEDCVSLANKINSGSLPFALTVDDSKLQVISPTLGAEALHTMTLVGIIAFAIICVLIIARYRLIGLIACVSLCGQIGGIFACASGFFGGMNGFTLTIPGIAGIILSIGMGIDANVITAERILDEMRAGKTVTGAINDGCRNAMSAIVDGNVTNVIVAVVLMGCFGPSDSLFAKLFSPLVSLFGASVSGAVYSFGYTQFIGVIFNFIMGVFAAKIMLKSLSGFKCMRKPWLYGGVKHVEE